MAGSPIKIGSCVMTNDISKEYYDKLFENYALCSSTAYTALFAVLKINISPITLLLIVLLIYQIPTSSLIASASPSCLSPLSYTPFTLPSSFSSARLSKLPSHPHPHHHHHHTRVSESSMAQYKPSDNICVYYLMNAQNVSRLGCQFLTIYIDTMDLLKCVRSATTIATRPVCVIIYLVCHCSHIHKGMWPVNRCP